MDPGPQAYGAGKVGGAFNIQNFVRKPHVFVRLLSLVSKHTSLFRTLFLLSFCALIRLFSEVLVTQILKNISKEYN